MGFTHRLDERGAVLGPRLLVEAREGSADLLVGRVLDRHLDVHAARTDEGPVEPILGVGGEEEDGSARVADAIERIQETREGD